MTYSCNSKSFDDRDDFLNCVFYYLGKGARVAIRVSKKELPKVAKKINKFLKENNVSVQIGSDSDPKALKIVSHAFVGGLFGGTIGCVVGGAGGAALAQTAVKAGAKVALKKAAERGALAVIPGGQAVAVALTVSDVAFLGYGLATGGLAGGLTGGTIGAAAGTALSFYEIEIKVEINNGGDDDINLTFLPA